MRDETEQAAYLRELLAIFEEEASSAPPGSPSPPHRPGDPARDLDLASYGVVKMLGEGRGTAYPGMAWEPKESFHALAAAYAS